MWDDHVEPGCFVEDPPPAGNVVRILADVAYAFAQPRKTVFLAEVTHGVDGAFGPVGVDGDARGEPAGVTPQDLDEVGVAGELLLGCRRLCRLRGHQHSPADAQAIEVADHFFTRADRRGPAEGELAIKTGRVNVTVEHERQLRKVEHLVNPPIGEGASLPAMPSLTLR